MLRSRRVNTVLLDSVCITRCGRIITGPAVVTSGDHVLIRKNFILNRAPSYQV